MDTLIQLLNKNREWADSVKQKDPNFFEELAAQQSPEYLWIGCSDSRVPANQIMGLLPGEVFVHRNIANVVSLDDENALSVIQFAVQALKVSQIIVCGHYGCGGVQAALDGVELEPPVSNWLQPIKQMVSNHRADLEALPSADRARSLCEWNVLAQMKQVCKTDTVRSAWAAGQSLRIHGWVYDLHDGILNPLCPSIADSGND
ncbi:MAG: carbonic anhydrase [Pseudomonadales bacterium]